MSWLDNESNEIKSFFTTPLVNSKSTFGTSIKVKNKPVEDNGFDFALEALDWTCRKQFGALTSRPRIVRNLGSLQRPPGPGQYDDQDKLRSKLETAPSFSIISRKTLKSCEERMDIPGPGSYTLPDGVEVNKVTLKRDKINYQRMDMPRCKYIIAFAIDFVMKFCD